MVADAPLAPPSNAKTDPDLAGASSAEILRFRKWVSRRSRKSTEQPGAGQLNARHQGLPARRRRVRDPTVSLKPPVSQKRHPFPTANHHRQPKKRQKANKRPGSPTTRTPHPTSQGQAHLPMPPFSPLPPSPPSPQPTHTSRKGGVALNKPRVAVSAALGPKREPRTPAGQHPHPLPPKIEKNGGRPSLQMGWEALSCLY